MNTTIHAAWFAVGFLTRLPVPAAAHVGSSDALRMAPRFFPAVGVLVGALTATAYGASQLVLPPLVAAAVACSISALLTGAMHEDGLADCADALGGGADKERSLSILKDSRLGTYGSVALTLGLLLRASVISVLHGPSIFVALIVAGALGRWMALAHAASLPPVPGRPGLSSGLGANIGASDLAIGSIWVAPAVLVLGVTKPAVVVVLIPILFCLHFFGVRIARTRFGGTTGDQMGAITFIAELAVLLAASSRIES